VRHILRYKLHDVDLDEGEFVIGRGATSALCLDDPLVSRAHARLVVATETVSIEDLGSRNGVKVNGQRIQGSQTLASGDQIMIGSQEILLLSRREAVADTLVQPPSGRGVGFGLMGSLAEKALGLGRGEEAERLVGPQLDQVRSDIESGRSVSQELLERTTDYALRIAVTTQNPRWTDFIFRLYSALRRPCPAPVVDQLYTIVRKLQKPTPLALRGYLGVLRDLELGPADRFLVNRIEGLERLLSAR
jgi:hypothetical protein